MTNRSTKEPDVSCSPPLIAIDLEGILTPEIWIAVAERTGIDRLRLTTRDIPDYDQLMTGRLRILRDHHLRMRDIQAVIETLDPLPGALDFLNWARSRAPLVILSDTFYEFARPLMAKLGDPTLFCNSLEIDRDNRIAAYHLRQPNGKQRAVAGFKGLGFRVLAIGDSYNDTAMLGEADGGILFRPSANVAAEFPQFPVCQEYGELRVYITEHLKEDHDA